MTLRFYTKPWTNESMVSGPIVSQSDGTRVWNIQYSTELALFMDMVQPQTEASRRGDDAKEV